MRTGHNKAERQSHTQRSGSTHKHQKCGALVGVRPCLVLHCTAQYSSLYGFFSCFYLSSSHRVFIPSYSNIILSANNTVQTSTIFTERQNAEANPSVHRYGSTQKQQKCGVFVGARGLFVGVRSYLLFTFAFVSISFRHQFILR